MGRNACQVSCRAVIIRAIGHARVRVQHAGPISARSTNLDCRYANTDNRGARHDYVVWQRRNSLRTGLLLEVGWVQAGKESAALSSSAWMSVFVVGGSIYLVNFTLLRDFHHPFPHRHLPVHAFPHQLPHQVFAGLERIFRMHRHARIQKILIDRVG